MKKSWWIPIILAVAGSFLTGKWTTSPETIVKETKLTDTLFTTITDTFPMFVVRTVSQTDTFVKGDTIFISRVETVQAVQPENWMAVDTFDNFLRTQVLSKYPARLTQMTYGVLKPYYLHQDRWLFWFEGSLIDDISVGIDRRIGKTWYGVGFSSDKELKLRIGKSL